MLVGLAGLEKAPNKALNMEKWPCLTIASHHQVLIAYI
jgi:hypothetical protein